MTRSKINQIAKNKVDACKPAGAEFFSDSESFMNELSNDQSDRIVGGLQKPTITDSPLCVPTM